MYRRLFSGIIAQGQTTAFLAAMREARDHQTGRGIRVGGLTSTLFRCEVCSTRAVANGYFVFSALYVVIFLVLLSLLLFGVPAILGPLKFEYLAGITFVLLLLAIFFLSPYYWKAVIRWTEAQ